MLAQFVSFLFLLITVNAYPAHIDLVSVLNDSDVSWTKNTVADDQLVVQSVQMLYSIGNDTSLSKCEKCKSRLLFGKSLAFTRADLIPTIWKQWCLESGYETTTTCLTNFGRNTVSNSSTGSNFADMLSLMNPLSMDGDYYCHYKESNQCALPVTPSNLSISYMWNNTKPAKAYVAPQPSNETFNVLHISDFHIELDYTVGTDANCSASMCCTPHTSNSKKVPQNHTSTGYNSFYTNANYAVNGTFTQGDWVNVNESSVWVPATTFGNYKCDAPEVLINSSLHSIGDYQKSNNISFDFAIFTGDLVDHDETAYTGYDMTVESEQIIFRDIKNTLDEVPVYSVLGNHDTFPYGEIAQEKSGFQNKFDWNAELMSDLWYDYGWLNASEAQQVKTHYTGFSVTTKQGLKIISLNSNCWYMKNHYAYWNTVEDPDSFGQFEFLISELLDSEANDQRVWIIYHIPVSSDILPPQAKLFGDVIERFSPYTIAAIFNGHTHRDEFQIMYKGNGTSDTKTEDNVVNNAWICQAVTPWVENNPGWRYYEIDTETFSIMNAYNFYTKLNETFTNNGSEPVWNFEYSSRTAYNIDWPTNAPLNATYWHKVATSIGSSNGTLQTYENFAKRFSPYTGDCSTGACDTDYCYVTSFYVDQYANCLNEFNITS
ncbi:uncharacterized protein SCDLUD_004568 [Saccharomycodes ludwigii]|uniref:uncharacterized protein n=1 Tax=Saccharomycodes ludwigii TaxID=36035 RepID=UPI001E83E95C|nr:hypothetical protein SCDLUD_004568 [Saccharomycodes ludwigii]KAH3899141.1 hypothetical protein SCDLUD_004568 [Saccharomycodes ludwigii]